VVFVWCSDVLWLARNFNCCPTVVQTVVPSMYATHRRPLLEPVVNVQLASRLSRLRVA